MKDEGGEERRLEGGLVFLIGRKDDERNGKSEKKD